MLAAFPIFVTENLFAGFFRITFASHIPRSKGAPDAGMFVVPACAVAPRFEQNFGGT